MRIIAWRTGLLFSVVLLAAATFVPASAAGNARRPDGGYPEIAEILSKDKKVRSNATWQYWSTHDKLTKELAQVVHPDTGGKLDKELRGTACFLLAVIRTRNRKAIESLIAAIDESFQPAMTSEIAFSGIQDPSRALIAIGRPAVAPMLDELANTEDKQKTASLRRVLQVIEGVDCALIRVQAHINKEADPKKKARLKATLKYFEDRKVNMRASRPDLRRARLWAIGAGAALLAAAVVISLVMSRRRRRRASSQGK